MFASDQRQQTPEFSSAYPVNKHPTQLCELRTENRELRNNIQKMFDSDQREQTPGFSSAYALPG
jgi:hypothetical protein